MPVGKMSLAKKRVKKLWTTNLAKHIEINYIEWRFRLAVCIRYLDLTCLTDARWLFLGLYWPRSKRVVFFEAGGAMAKIGSSLKSHHRIKLNLLKSLIHTVSHHQIKLNLLESLIHTVSHHQIKLNLLESLIHIVVMEKKKREHWVT